MNLSDRLAEHDACAKREVKSNRAWREECQARGEAAVIFSDSVSAPRDLASSSTRCSGSVS